MGLFRLAVIGAVGIALLPSDRDQQQRLYQRAATAANWAVTFCDRNAQTCQQASGFLAEFKKKAEFGAELAVDMIRTGDANAELTTASIPESAPAGARTVKAPLRNTLTVSDLKPEWRGKASDSRSR
jgi:hypothetical protein